MTLDLILNPNAGTRQGMVVAQHVADQLRSAGATLREHVSEYPGHAVEHAAKVAGGAREAQKPADPGWTDGIVAVGGDGTLFEVLNGVHRDGTGAIVGTGPRIPLGIVPVGTGNSFVRDIGISTAKEAVNAILRGNTQPVDLGVFTADGRSYAFINLLGAGFVSNVAHRADRYKRLGALSYVIAVVQETIALKTDPLVLTVDGRRIERHAVFVEVCNSRYTGGAMMMAPGAQIDDGVFDVVMMNACTRRKLLSLFPRIFSGTHVEDPLLEVFQGREITVETVRPWLLTPDGETFGQTPISVRMLPGAIDVFVPV